MTIGILGGGLAGISAAIHLSPELQFTVFEKESRLGGLLRTDTVDQHLFDHGPHLFFHQDPYFIETFSKALQTTGFLMRPAKTGQWSFSKLIEFPYAVHLYGLPENVVQACVGDYVKACENVKQRTASGSLPTVRNYEEYCRLYFGNGFTDHFMIPYACKIWTVHPRDLATDWMGPRIVVPDLNEVLRGAQEKRSSAANYIREFRYPKTGGTESFVRGLSAGILDRVSVSSEIARIHLKQKEIELANGKRQRFETLISSLPLPELPKLIPDLPHGIQDAIAKLDWFGVALLNFAHEDITANEYQWIYFDQSDAVFHRIHYPSKLAPSMAPEGSVSLQAEISFSKHRPLKDSIDTCLEKSWKNLQTLGFGADKTPRVSFGRKVEYAYAIMNQDRQSCVQYIHEYFKSKGLYPCGRFGDWDYIWTDKVLASGKRTAEEVNKIYA